MSAQCQSILEAALALNDKERSWLAERLLESLDPSEDMPDGELPDEEAFAAEIERRFQQVRDGSVTLIPWFEVEEKE